VWIKLLNSVSSTDCLLAKVTNFLQLAELKEGKASMEGISYCLYKKVALAHKCDYRHLLSSQTNCSSFPLQPSAVSRREARRVPRQLVYEPTK